MKLRKMVLSLWMAVSAVTAMADANNQCLVFQKESRNPSDEIKNRLDECVKKKNCSAEDKAFICPWAFNRRELKQPNLPPEDKKVIDDTCKQCEQLAIISCGYELDAANMQFNKMMKIFIEDNDAKKPLIFGFEKPTPVSNNVNLSANIARLTGDNEAYKADIKQLTTKLAVLAQNVTTQEIVRNNIKKSQQLVSDFSQKWSVFHKNSIQMSKLVTELEDFMINWQDRVEFLQEQEGCQPIIEQVNKAAFAGSDVIARLDKANNTLENLEFGKRLKLTSEFSENAIKQSYVQTSKKSLEDLLSSIGAVLRLDEELTRSNLWWIEATRGGLAQSLHTTYYQYKKPLQILITEVAEGQAFINNVKAIKGVSASALDAAVKGLQNRILLIQDDIDWLQSRGWKGQLTSQLETAEDWYKSLSNKNSACGKLLKSYLDVSKRFEGENYELFETELEPSFIQAIQACEKE